MSSRKQTPKRKTKSKSKEYVVTWQREAMRYRCLADDVFLRVALYKRPEVAKAILEPILEKKDIEIMEMKVQDHSDLVAGHSVVFDAVIKTVDGIIYNIEVQNCVLDAPLKRVRYYASMLDASSLKKGSDYNNLPRCVIIFIARGDYGKSNEPIYHVKRFYVESMKTFDDGQEIIIANLNNMDTSTDLGSLMHDMNAKDPMDIKNPILSDVVDRVKYDRGDKTVDEALHRFILEAMPPEIVEAEKRGYEKGKKGAEKQGKIEFALSLYKKKLLNSADAAKELGISEEDFLRLANDEK